MMDHNEAETPGEWLPHELAAEIRGLLAESPAAALSPGLSAWLACEANERCPQRDDRQRVQKRRLPEDDSAILSLWSSEAAVAPDMQTHEGTKWGASEQWMSGVFALLEPHNLKNARLVSQGWAKQTISMKSSISLTITNGQESENEFVQRVDGFSHMIGRNRLSGLEVLELENLSIFNSRGASPSISRLLTAACDGCPMLKTLKLNLGGMYNELVVALKPLLPRLQCLSLPGSFDSSLKWKVGELLSSMSSMTELHFDCSFDYGDAYDDLLCEAEAMIPGEVLAGLPRGLACLSIGQFFFDSISLRDLACSKSLTDLTIKKCYFNNSIGLSAAVNLKSLSILDEATVTRKDLEDVLVTLGKLEHLCIDLCDIEVFPDEDSATAFVQRLPESLPLVKSLELKSLSNYSSEGILVALGKITALTSLNLGKTFAVWEEDDIYLPPQSLRHLTTLKSLKHLSLNGLVVEEEEEEGEFFDAALSILQRLPSLESLDVTGLDVTELNAPLFPVQLQSLGIGDGLPRDQEQRTAALVALAERCPGLTSMIYSPYLNDMLSFQSLAAVHEKAPNLQFDVEPGIRSPVDYDDEVRMMMAELKDSLIRARPFLQLLKYSVPWNIPKHPWNLLSSREPWVVVARQDIIRLCRENCCGGVCAIGVAGGSCTPPAATKEGCAPCSSRLLDAQKVKIMIKCNIY